MHDSSSSGRMLSWANEHPRIIQGGMGIGVSGWQLARAVSRLGHLGVVSGTSIDTVMIRRLQDGDEGGHVRRAMSAFPIPDVSDDLLRRYYLAPGERGDTPYKLLPMFRKRVNLARQHVTMMANFVEVWLAKEGHDGVVGINLLTKVQMPNLSSLYGAMLAGVDYVLMGAGIPREIPGALDALAEHRVVRLKLEVEGPAGVSPDEIVFDPRDHMGCERPPLARPRFIPIVSASSLATNLARKSSGRVDGFIVEGPTAGGHNAPPRGEPRFSEDGEPLRVRTDSRASPTGYPFKVVHVDGLQNQDDARARNCDLGYLRTAYRTPAGTVGYRCAAEPVEDFVAKGGNIADTVGRRCLCNGLTANIGQPQHRANGDELPLLTSGDDLVSLDSFARGRTHYSAAEVVDYLCSAALAEV